MDTRHPSCKGAEGGPATLSVVVVVLIQCELASQVDNLNAKCKPFSGCCLHGEDGFNMPFRGLQHHTKKF